MSKSLGLPLALLLCWSIPAAAIPEDGYEEALQKNVIPTYDNGGTVGTLLGVDDVPLHYVAFEKDQEKGAVVLVNGRGNSTMIDKETIYDLGALGYSVYSYDHRGQGQSGRILTDNPNKGYVKHFQDYVDDLEKFINVVVKHRAHSKVVLMGHSMGGAVVTLFAEQFPGAVDAVILTVPMHLPYYAAFPEDVAAGISIGALVTRKEEQYAIGQHDPDPDPQYQDNQGSQSRVRFDAWKATVLAHPEIRLGGPTFGWVWETLKATKTARSEAWRIQEPVLMIQAGKDKTVNNQGSTAACNRMRHCRRIQLKGAAHSIFYETDANRNQAMAEISAFLDNPGTGCTQASPSLWGVTALLAWGLLRLRRQRG